MAEFPAYESQRIGTGGPFNGAQYNVMSWFPEPATTAVSENDVFTDESQDRLIVGMKILLDTSGGGDKSVLIRSKQVGETPSIFAPGVDLFRWFLSAGASSGSNEVRIYSGWTNRASATAIQLWVPVRFYMDKTMNLSVSMTNFDGQSMQIHYMTGPTDSLLSLI